MLPLLAALLLAAPPCDSPALRPARCPVPPTWVCLPRELAAAEAARVDADRQRCEARLDAARAEADSELALERGRAEADAAAARVQLAAAADLVEQLERRAHELEDRPSTGELVVWTVGGVAVGVGVGVLVGWVAGL